MSSAWEPEEIPDRDLLFMRIHANDLEEDGTPKPGAFRNSLDPITGVRAMSTDWSKYTHAEDTLRRGRQEPSTYGVLSLSVGDVRAIPDQIVLHTPDGPRDNRAHADVRGQKNPKTRSLFLDAYRIEIRRGSVVE